MKGNTTVGAGAAGKVLLDADAIRRTLSRIAHEIIEQNEALDDVALVGIHTRGVPLAQRLRRLIAELTGREVRLGSVDITFYRDDVQVRGGEAPRHPQPVVRDSLQAALNRLAVEEDLLGGNAGLAHSRALAQTCVVIGLLSGLSGPS